MTEEIRFAVVLNGGVSLAVWMGGAAHELNELTRVGPGRTDAYASAMAALGLTARADVVAGTSAGGINGAALAIGQVNANADLAGLRALWADQGSMDALLRPPFQGQPASLLRGEYFHEQLLTAMRLLATDFRPSGRPVDLTLTTTVLGGVQDVTYDDLGQTLADVTHTGRFHFDQDDLADDRRPTTVPALALAARSTASFPAAFEPAFVPVPNRPPSGTEPSDPLRPDMSRFADWAHDRNVADGDRSRFVVDGGVLANMPTLAALDAIDRMSADGPVHRVMLMVYPHAPAARTETAADPEKPPSLVAALAGVSAVLASQGSRTFAADVDDRNLAAQEWRDGREFAVSLLARHAGLVDPAMREMFERQCMDQVTARWAALAPAPQRRSLRLVREDVAAALRRRTVTDHDLPFVSAAGATSAGWSWDATMALGVSDGVLDVLRRALDVVDAAQADPLRRAVRAVGTARTALAGLRDSIEDRVVTAPIPDGEDAVDWDRRLAGVLVNYRGHTDELRARVDDILGALLTAAPGFAAVHARPEAWRRASLTGWEPLAAHRADTPDERAQLLDWLIRIEIVTAVLTSRPRPGNTWPISLVQLSLQTENPLLTYSTTGEDKLAGLTLGHFGGFLKRSWRVNDWTWGRLDAAAVLMRVLLTEERVRELVRAGGRPTAIVDDRMIALFGSSDPPGRLGDLARRARACLTEPSGDVGPLVDLFVAARSLEIIATELPVLADAVESDRRDGAGTRSNGEAFLSANRDLIARLRVPGAGASVDDRIAALAAFDRAGIGREPLFEEAGSDQLIRTAVTAASTAVTVLDSDRLGFGVLKPVSRTLRGAALLPYWVVNGLVRGGTARFVALSGLVVAAVLLGLSLLDVLPSGLAAAGALIGMGAFLFGLGYAALRTGSLIHSAVLAAPIAPMAAIAIGRAVHGSASGDDKVFGVFTVTVLLGIVVVLIVLASLPNPIRSPWGTTSAAWRRAARAAGSWQALALRVLALLAAVGFGVRLVMVLVDDWDEVSRLVVDHRVWLWVPAVAVAVSGAVVAYRAGIWLRRWRQPGPDADWSLGKVSHPAGVSAGWSWVYGLVYAGIAVLCFVVPAALSATAPAAGTTGVAATRSVLLEPAATQGPTAPRTSAVTAEDIRRGATGLGIGSVLIAPLLLVVFPLAIPAAARRRLSAALAADPVLHRALHQPGGRTAAQAFVAALVRRGCTYRYLVVPSRHTGRTLVPTSAGRDLMATLELDGRRAWCSVPVTVHALAAAVAGTVALGLPWPVRLPPWVLLAAGVVVVVVAAVVEGSSLGRARSDRQRLPGGLAAGTGLVGLVLVAVGAQSVLDRIMFDVRALAPIVALASVAVLVTVQVLLVLYVRRGSARRTESDSSG